VESQFLTVIFSIINNGSDGHVSDGPTWTAFTGTPTDVPNFFSFCAWSVTILTTLNIDVSAALAPMSIGNVSDANPT
jgi:hypothetical protein